MEKASSSGAPATLGALRLGARKDGAFPPGGAGLGLQGGSSPWGGVVLAPTGRPPTTVQKPRMVGVQGL